jgi:DNA-binding NarL/FixJ family response regulator
LPIPRIGQCAIGQVEPTVLLVDDQQLVRSGLRRILRRKDGFTIVAECSDDDEVPHAIAEHHPDVVVMDLRMKRVDGIEATRRLSAPGSPPVLALTTFNDDGFCPALCVPASQDSCSKIRRQRS